jgi:hypothetical protein
MRPTSYNQSIIIEDEAIEDESTKDVAFEDESNH